MGISPAPVTRPDAGLSPLRTALEAGQVCAVARQNEHDLRQCAKTYPELFPDKPFGPALFGSVALACAFGAPGLSAGQLRVANRSALWVFAVDWLIDARAESAEEVDDLVGRSLAVARGGAPSDPLSAFLADIRTELATAPGGLDARWTQEVESVLRCMAREWNWKTSGSLPDFDGYLDNADNFGSCLVNVSHWIANDFGDIRVALPASREVQRILRLLNDLRTYERDLAWGDLNALLLGVSRTEVEAKVATMVEHCDRLLDPVRDSHPDVAVYLSRQIGFSMGFYGEGDYWGSL